MIFQSFQQSVTCLLIKLLEMKISVPGVLWVGGWMRERGGAGRDGGQTDRRADGSNRCT